MRRHHGVAVAAIRNNNHLGMLAHYVEHIAERGHIGLAMSSSEALVHPFGGTRAMLGTNPIAIAVPTASRPLVLDLATSTVSMGKIHHYRVDGSDDAGGLGARRRRGADDRRIPRQARLDRAPSATRRATASALRSSS